MRKSGERRAQFFDHIETEDHRDSSVLSLDLKERMEAPTAKHTLPESNALLNFYEVRFRKALT
jgi:hypothetical protein